MPNQQHDSSQDFGPNLGTILVCAAALVMIYTAVQNPTPFAIGVAALLTVCGAGLLAWRVKVRKER